MPRAERPGGPVAAAQNFATYGPCRLCRGAGDVRRGTLCGGFVWRLSMRV